LAETGEVVLDEKNARKAEPLGLDDIMDEIVIGGAVAGRPATSSSTAEKPEFHLSPSSGVAAHWCPSPNIRRDRRRVDETPR
jgi:hypothetical protein